jgi:hypothetical protein
MLFCKQELAKQMLQQADELLGIDLLSGRQSVKLSIGLAHVLTLEVHLLPVQTCWDYLQHSASARLSVAVIKSHGFLSNNSHVAAGCGTAVS